ncbi:MAG: hypothetical protein AAGD13_01580 [Pseudomonadota bacterium]
MKYYFMPYDPANWKILVAQREYAAVGAKADNGQMLGMKKNAHSMRDDLEQGILSTGVWFNPNNDKLKFCADLKDQLWIRGHGMPGQDTIEGGRGGEKASSATVAKRILDSGLPKSFSGAVVCYNCHSAESGPKGDPFAKRLGKALRDLGYKNCKVFGFLGAIDSYAKQGPNGKQIYARGKLQTILGTMDQATVQFHM